MSWIKYFDKIYLINLPRRTDRLEEAKKELAKFNIPYTLVPALDHENGAYGLYMTVLKIMGATLINGHERILILEDDIEFHDNVNNIMDEAVGGLPADWDLLYLGANVNAPLHFVGDALLQCEYLLSTHAVGYSKEAIKTFLTGIQLPDPEKKNFVAIDSMLVFKLQSLGKSYLVNPMVAFQKEGYSDVRKKDVEYNKMMNDKFCERVKQMKDGHL